MKKTKERSLKKRINKTISALNFYSLLVVMTALIITLGLSLKSFGGMISDNAINQMSNQLKLQLSKSTEKQTSNESNKETNLGNESNKTTNLSTEEVFRGIGFSYTFLPNDEQKLKIRKGIQLNVPASNEKPMLTIDYTIFRGNKVVYDSQPNDFFTKGILGSLMDKLNETSVATINDESGKELYKLQVKLNPAIIFALYLGLISICFVIFVITMLISKIIGRMLTSIIIKPLTDLDKKMSELSNGNIEAAMVTEITFKKPIIEVKRLAGFTNAIMAKMNEYAKKLANQNTELEAQNITLNENSKVLENMNHDLDDKNLKLKNIFDNVEQGFLTFNSDLLIHAQYSAQCEKLFHKLLTNEKLSSLFYPDNLKMKSFMDELLEKIFEEEGSRREIYFPLLPEELNINNEVVKVDYKMVKNEKGEDTLIVMITDITEKRYLEKQRAEESKILKMVVKTIINREEFRDLVKAYKTFSMQDFGKIPKENYDSILRQIHTYKGNFSQYEMVNLVQELNELENKLYDKENTDFQIAAIKGSKLKEWIKNDLDIIEKYAGKGFFNDKELCYINKEKIKQIEEKIKETLAPNEFRVILPMIKSLSYKSARDMLKTYPDYILKLSERLGKTISPLEITGDDVMVDAEYLNDAFKAMVHIFRNAVDHGIETEDERLEMGKELIGSITCKIEDFGENFKIMIADDGRGINTEALEEKVLKNGIYKEIEIADMSDHDKLNFIFEQGITIKETSSYISGRGIGMSSVKEKIEEINGIIEVESVMNKGTSITLILPKHSKVLEVNVSANEFMNNLINTSKEILSNQMEISLCGQAIINGNTIKLNEVTALLSLKGSLNAIVMISVNEVMAKKLVSGFLIEKVEENDIINYIEDVIGEISNTILGATFGKYQDTDNFFHISIPVVISNSGGYIKQTQAEILTCNLLYNECQFNINILLMDEDVSYS